MTTKTARIELANPPLDILTVTKGDGSARILVQNSRTRKQIGVKDVPENSFPTREQQLEVALVILGEFAGI